MLSPPRCLLPKSWKDAGQHRPRTRKTQRFLLPSPPLHAQQRRSGAKERMEEHNSRVSQIASRVRSFHEKGTHFRVYHGSTNTTRRTALSRDNIVDTSKMDNVIRFDKSRQTIFVEPNVSMEQLVDATLAEDLLPLVVPEFPAITVGGAFAGTAGESSSFRHGLFDNTVSSIEIVLSDGEVVNASEHENADLFNAAAGTFGTFGVLCLLGLRLREAKPYVEVLFQSISSTENAIQRIEALTADSKTDYLEGILFARHQGLIISGQLADKVDPSLQVSKYTRPQDPWFYLRAESILRSGKSETRELVPVKDYFFRYDRGAFWAGKYAFQYFITPFNSLTRWLLDGFMRTKTMYHAMHKSHIADQFIVQDIGFPYNSLESFISYVDQTFGFWPIWLCPLKMKEDTSLRPRSMACYSKDARSPGMMLNVGLWGPGPKQFDQFILANRDVEKKTQELGGLKCFYAQAYYTEDEFWQIYDREWYDRLRQKYKATGLKSVYEKVNVDFNQRRPAKDQSWGEWAYEQFKEQWPVRGVYGVLCVLTSREYLLS